MLVIVPIGAATVAFKTSLEEWKLSGCIVRWFIDYLLKLP